MCYGQDLQELIGRELERGSHMLWQRSGILDKGMEYLTKGMAWHIFMLRVALLIWLLLLHGQNLQELGI